MYEEQLKISMRRKDKKGKKQRRWAAQKPAEGEQDIMTPESMAWDFVNDLDLGDFATLAMYEEVVGWLRNPPQEALDERAAADDTPEQGPQPF